ncbi:hypothetical protein QQG55_23285 [Brugia pahangi]
MECQLWNHKVLAVLIDVIISIRGTSITLSVLLSTCFCVLWTGKFVCRCTGESHISRLHLHPQSITTKLGRGKNAQHLCHHYCLVIHKGAVIKTGRPYRSRSGVRLA